MEDVMLRPSPGRVLIKRIAEPKPASSLILVPESVSDKPSRFAVVMAVGRLKDRAYNVGETVIMSDYAGAPCTVVLGGEEIEAFVIREEDVIAVVEE